MTPAPAEAGRAPEDRISTRARQRLLELARAALEAAVRGAPPPPWPDDDPDLAAHRASFVTLRVRATGELRGCRGEVAAVRPLAESVIAGALAAALDDPRFPPVTPLETPDLTVEISALTPMRPSPPANVDVTRHGVMITLRGRRGLLLPQVAAELGWDREELLAGVCQKAGLPSGAWRESGAQLMTFEAEVWGEEVPQEEQSR